MKAKDIIRALVATRFPPRRYAVCPNVSWAILPWEADLLAVSTSGVRHEIEVKISSADLWRDRQKPKWKGEGPQAYVDFFWYAVPRDLVSEALELARGNGSGVLLVSGMAPGEPYNTEEVLKPKRSRRIKSDAVTAEAVYRLASLRFWDLYHKEAREAERGDDTKGEVEAGAGGDSHRENGGQERGGDGPQVL